ncbi:MAG: hypothetical protein U9N84_09520 [Actinomycetota bacterium]|nr:hypothetical protein [Actinomycetota bacterium]
MADPRERYYRGLFGVAAVYDLVLGIIFLFFGRWAFDALDIPEKYPEGGFVPLVGAFVLVLGVGYYLIWRGDLWRNRDLVAIGTLYKLAYTGVGLYIAIAEEVPHALFLWGFGVADAVFFVLMAECLLHLYREKPGVAVPV